MKLFRRIAGSMFLAFASIPIARLFYLAAFHLCILCGAPDDDHRSEMEMSLPQATGAIFGTIGACVTIGAASFYVVDPKACEKKLFELLKQ